MAGQQDVSSCPPVHERLTVPYPLVIQGADAFHLDQCAQGGDCGVAGP